TSSREVSALSEDGASVRPRAWDFRRFRFSRNASFSRSRRESFTPASPFPDALPWSPVIVGLPKLPELSRAPRHAQRCTRPYWVVRTFAAMAPVHLRVTIGGRPQMLGTRCL